MLPRDTNFIGDNDSGMSNALVDLIGFGTMMELPVLYTLLQWLQVQILRIQALQVENNGAHAYSPSKPLLRFSSAGCSPNSEGGAGLIFDAVTSDQRRILRGWLFSGRNGRLTGVDDIAQEPRAVA
jgi:hypothetical protein